MSCGRLSPEDVRGEHGWTDSVETCHRMMTILGALWRKDQVHCRGVAMAHAAPRHPCGSGSAASGVGELLSVRYLRFALVANVTLAVRRGSGPGRRGAAFSSTCSGNPARGLCPQASCLQPAQARLVAFGPELSGLLNRPRGEESTRRALFVASRSCPYPCGARGCAGPWASRPLAAAVAGSSPLWCEQAGFGLPCGASVPRPRHPARPPVALARRRTTAGRTLAALELAPGVASRRRRDVGSSPPCSPVELARPA